MGNLPELVRGQILLVIAPHAAREGMLQLAAGLAVHSSLRVLDGGNQFNAYQVARAARRQKADIDTILERIFLARAFTCYQMEALLQGTQAHPFPTLVLDFLSTFHDENVPMAERRRLLQHCARHLRRLSQPAAVVITARPAGPDQPERVELLAGLRRCADAISEWEAPAAAAPQPLLF
jgi:hypothetical protein